MEQVVPRSIWLWNRLVVMEQVDESPVEGEPLLLQLGEGLLVVPDAEVRGDRASADRTLVQFSCNRKYESLGK